MLIEEKVKIIKQEIFNSNLFIQNHYFFQKNYKFNFKGIKFNQITYPKEQIESLTNFFFEYYLLLGLFLNNYNKDYINEQRLKVLTLKDEFNKYNSEGNQFDIHAIFKTEIIPEALQYLNTDFDLVKFLTGKQIECLNRSLKLNDKKNKEKTYCLKSLNLLSEITLSLIEFIFEQDEKQIKDNFNDFFTSRLKYIKENKKREKLPELTNAYFNFFDIYERLKYF